MVTKRDDNRQPTTDDDRVNIEQSASGRLEGRVLQLCDRQTKQTNQSLIIDTNITVNHFPAGAGIL